MPKKRRKSSAGGSGTDKKDKPAHVPEYVSDDEALYGKTDHPDPASREYMYDEVDEFHANREKILLDNSYNQKDDDVAVSDEEEVLDLDSEESDDEEIRNLKTQLRRVKQMQRKEHYADDMEEQSDKDEQDEDLPDDKAWGKRRSRYYGDDDIDMGEMEEENAEAVLEEKEALRLQRHMAQQLDDDDFGLEIFKQTDKTPEETLEKEEKIVKDLSKLSKKEKLKLLKKESPELLTLIAEFKEKLTEVQERLSPLKHFIDEQHITGKAARFVNTKLKLLMNYCTNIAFYLLLKSKQVPVHNHPVIKRLLQYRNIIKQLEPLDKEIQEESDEILHKLKNGEHIDLVLPPQPTKTFARRKRSEKDIGKVSKPSEKKKQKLSALVADSDSEDSDMFDDLPTATKGKKKKVPADQYETVDEEKALEYYQMMKAGKQTAQDDDNDDLEIEDEALEDDIGGDEDGEEGYEEQDGKRAINYQIAKNKGLTASKKKELRNPRVKHRMKFKKAKTRRKGQFREPRTEMHKYGGEISGIRAAIKRGIKLK